MTSGLIKEPDKKVIVTFALITGVTPSSLNRSSAIGFTRDLPIVLADKTPVPIKPPTIGKADKLFNNFLLVTILLIQGSYTVHFHQ